MKRIYAIVALFVTALSSLLFSLKRSEENSANNLEFNFKSYAALYRMAEDSLVNSCSDSDVTLCVDSLFYFDPEGNRFVTSLHKSFKGKHFADELSFIYGEKISGQWFFFIGSTYLLPRILFNDNDSLPLSYVQFHATALEDIFYPFALNGNFDFKKSHVAKNGLVKEKF